MRSQIRMIALRRKCCALRARARVRVCARGRPDAPSERGERCPRVNGASDRRPFYQQPCGRVNGPAPTFTTFFRNFGTDPPWASKNVGEARAAPKRQAALRRIAQDAPRCPTFARRAWGAPVARPREVAHTSRPGGLPANPSGSSPGPIKALGAGRSGTTKQSLFFVRNIFNGTFKGNTRRIHEHCER